MLNKTELNHLLELAEKEKDISAKMSNESLLVIIEKLNHEPHIFKEIFPFAVS